MQGKKLSGKLNRHILQLQDRLMSQLNSLDCHTQSVECVSTTECIDTTECVGMAETVQHDSLVSLISRSKDVTSGGKGKVGLVNSTRKSKAKEDVFLTGIVPVNRQGLKDDQRGQFENQTAIFQPQRDSNDILKELMSRNDSDLSQLRRQIKKTGKALQSCSRKFGKSSKSILQVADRVKLQMDVRLLDGLNSYQQFSAKSLADL